VLATIKTRNREVMANSTEGKTDTAPEALAVQYEIYRKMSPARKFQLILDTYEMGKRLAMAGIRMRNPEATKEQVWRLWARQHLGPELFETVYGKLYHE
jgi:hypothetical protein